jgi:hypothetical protein
MWGADATQLQMDSGHHGKVLFSVSPSSPPPHFFFFFKKENRKRCQAQKNTQKRQNIDPSRPRTVEK